MGNTTRVARLGCVIPRCSHVGSGEGRGTEHQCDAIRDARKTRPRVVTCHRPAQDLALRPVRGHSIACVAAPRPFLNVVEALPVGPQRGVARERAPTSLWDALGHREGVLHDLGCHRAQIGWHRAVSPVGRRLDGEPHHGVGQGRGRAVCTRQRGAPSRDVGEQGADIVGVGGLGPCGGGVDESVVVAAGSERGHARSCGGEVVHVGELGQILGRGRLRDAYGGLVAHSASRPVAPLPNRKEQQAALKVIGGEAGTNALEGVGERVRDLAAAEHPHEVMHACPRTIDLGEVGLVNVPAQHMERGAIFGKPRGGLHAHEGVRVVCDFECTVNCVVIGEGHKRHAPSLGRLVGVLWCGVRLRQARALQKPVAGLR